MEARVRDQGKHGLVGVRLHSNDADGDALAAEATRERCRKSKNKRAAEKTRELSEKNDTKGMGSSTRFVGIQE